MKELVIGLMLWISTLTGWAVPPAPEVIYENGKVLKHMLYGCDNPRTEESKEICTRIEKTTILGTRKDTTMGLYDHQKKIVYLNPLLKKHDKPVHDSVLLHELVHHMQFHNKVKFRCLGELEEKAYMLQDKWLQKKGRKSVFEELEISPLYFYIIIQCPEEGEGMFSMPPDYEK